MYRQYFYNHHLYYKSNFILVLIEKKKIEIAIEFARKEYDCRKVSFPFQVVNHNFSDKKSKHCVANHILYENTHILLKIRTKA